MIYSCSFSGNR